MNGSTLIFLLVYGQFFFTYDLIVSVSSLINRYNKTHAQDEEKYACIILVYIEIGGILRDKFNLS